MYTSKITNKEEVSQGLKMTVEFTNGVKTLIETIIPQDETGFLYWLKSRLASLNSIEALDSKYVTDVPLDLTETVVPKTSAQIAQEEWFAGYARLSQVQELITLGIVATDNPKVLALRNKLKTDFKPEYLGLI